MGCCENKQNKLRRFIQKGTRHLSSELDIVEIKEELNKLLFQEETSLDIDKDTSGDEDLTLCEGVRKKYKIFILKN